MWVCEILRMADGSFIVCHLLAINGWHGSYWFWLGAALQKLCSWSSTIQNTIGIFLEVLRFEPGAAGWETQPLSK